MASIGFKFKLFEKNMNIKNTSSRAKLVKARFRRTVLRIIGLLLIISSMIMLPPIFVGLSYKDGDIVPFVDGFALLFFSGSLLLVFYRKAQIDLKIRSGFMVVGLSWLIIGVSCSIPLYLAESLNLSITDSVFESISALTTTGATVISHLDNLPHSILLFRQLLQWLGGMGIIVLAIAILPMLRIGGMQMFKAETPGPMKDQKLTPRITETSKTLWFLYLGITMVCAMAYYMAGMNGFDAIGHAFSTISTGGMSTHDDSIAYFDNSVIETISMVFMFIAGINFAAHFVAWRSASMNAYLNDTEIRTYSSIIIAAVVLISVVLIWNNSYGSLYETIRHTSFQVVSMMTTTGFTTENVSNLPGLVPFLLILLGTTGACAGSTSGGIKLIRLVLLYKLSMRELYRLIHPHGQFLIKLDGKIVNYRVLDSVSAFILQFMFIAIIFTLFLLLFGEDLTTSGTTVLSSLANIGPALGDAGINFSQLSDSSKWTLALAMIFGRLEIFTIFVMLIPAYWEN